MGAGVGLIATLLAAMTGDNSAYRVAQVQPMKLAAMEALYNGGNGEKPYGNSSRSPIPAARLRKRAGASHAHRHP